MKKIIPLLIFLLFSVGGSSQIIQLLKPSKGDLWPVYSTQRISWTSSNINNIKIESSLDSGRTWNLIISSYPATAQYYDWQVSGRSSDSCFIRISDVTNSTTNSSNYPGNPFVIPASYIQLDSLPASIQSKAVLPITWTSGGVRKINIYVSTDNQFSYRKIADTVSAAAGYFNYVVPENISSCYIKLEDANNVALTSVSVTSSVLPMASGNAAKFHGGSFDGHSLSSSNPKSINLLVGNTVDSLFGNSNYLISWQQNNVDKINLYFSTDNGLTWLSIAQNLAASMFNYSWLVPTNPTTVGRVKIEDASDPSYYSISANPFVIRERMLKISSPDISQTINQGFVLPVMWTSGGVSRIKISALYNGNTRLLADSVNALQEVYNLLVSASLPDSFRVIIADKSYPATADTSVMVYLSRQTMINQAKYRGGAYDGHSIASNAPSSVQLISPNGGEVYAVSAAATIKWKSDNIERILLDFTSDGGVTWTNLTTNVAASAGQYTWQIPNNPSGNCKIRIRNVADTSVFDLSDSLFVIAGKRISNTTDTANWTKGTNKAIEWQASGIDKIKIFYKSSVNQSWKSLKDSILASSEVFNWNLPINLSDSVWLKLTDISDSTITVENRFILNGQTIPINITNAKFHGGSFDGYASSSSISYINKLRDSISFPQPANIEIFQPDQRLMATSKSNRVVKYFISAGPGTLNTDLVNGLNPGKVTVGAYIPSDSIYQQTDTTFRTFCINPLKPVIPYQGKLIICTNEQVTLTSPVIGVQYKWSTGDSSQSISVSVTKAISLQIGWQGCFSKSSDTLFFQKNETPVVSITNPGPITVCSGTPVTLNSSQLTGNQWLFNNNPISGANASNLSVVQSGIYSVIDSANGCKSLASNGVTVTIKQTPATPVISINGASNTNTFSFCSGKSVLLGTDAVSTIQWYKDGIALIGEHSNTLTVNSTGLYSVGASLDNCNSQISDAADLRSVALPSASISGTATVAQYASKPQVIFTGNNGVAPYRFVYTINNGSPLQIVSGLDGIASIPVATDSVGVFNYSIISVKDSSSLSCENIASGNATITVNAIPKAYIFGSTTVCQNDANPTVTFVGSDAKAPYVFTYTINGGTPQTIVSNGSTASLPISTALSGSIVVNLLSVQESSSIYIVSACNASVTITVNPQPSAKISESTAVCKDMPASIILTGSDAASPYLFSYTINDGAVQSVLSGSDGTTTLNVPTSVVGVINYKLISVYSLNFGISGTVSGCLSNINSTSSITVKPLPAATISGATIVCKNAPMPVVTFSGNNGVAPYIFTYKLNGGSLQIIQSDIAGIANIQVPTNIAGSYNYELVFVQEMIPNGCSNLATGSVKILVDQPTITGISSICELTQTQLSASDIQNLPNTWISFNTNYATVDNTGLVSGVSAGVATIQYTNNNGCSQTLDITVSGLSKGGSIAGSTTACANSNAGMLTLSGYVGAIIRWESSIDGINWNPIANTSSVLNYTNLSVTTQFRAVVQNSVCSYAYSSAGLIIITSASVGGTISGQNAVCIGSNIVLQLTGNTGAVVRWEYSTNAGKNWTAITNTSTTLSVTNLTVSTMYRAVILNSPCTTTVAYSNSFTVTVYPLSVGGTLSGSASVCANTNSGTLSLTGQIGSIIRWEVSVDAGLNWNAIANTTAKYTFNNLTQSSQFRAVVQSGSCSISYSSIATISLIPASIGGILSGSTTVCNSSNSGSITLTGQLGTVIRWESSVNAGGSWTGITNTTSMLNYSNLTKSTQYRAVVQNSTCSIAYSQIATITVNGNSFGGTLSGTATVCANTNKGSLTLSGQTGSILQWEYSVNGGTNWTSIANLTTSLTYTNLTQSTVYRVLIQNSPCSAVYSNSITITVTPASVGGIIVGSKTFSNGTNSGSLTLSGQLGKIVRWESSTDAGLNWTAIANTTTTLNYKNVLKTTVYRAVVQNSSCSVAYSQTATITIGVAVAATNNQNSILPNSINLTNDIVLEVLAFPNPTRSVFKLNLNASLDEPIKIIVYDYSGKVMDQFITKINEHLEFGSSYGNGIYILEAIQGELRKSIKLIKSQ